MRLRPPRIDCMSSGDCTRREHAKSSGEGGSQASRIRVTLRGCVLVAALGLMILVPMAALDDGRPARFGWHMYAASVYPPEIQVETKSAIMQEVKLVEVVARYRPEVDYFESVARHICGSDPAARVVRVQRDIPSRSEEYRCSSF